MAYGLTIMLASPLSQKLAGVLKQKQIIAIGELLKGLGIFLIVLGTQVSRTNFWLPLLGQIVGGIGFSLAISNDSSLLKSIVQSSEDSALFGRIQSETQSRMFISTLLAGSIGGILFDYEAHWPFYASMFANIVAISTILMVSETKDSPQTGSGSCSCQQNHKELSSCISLSHNQNFWMNYYALSRAFMLAPFVGFLPFFFLNLQVDFYLFGIVLGLFSVAAFLSALYSISILEKLGILGTILLTSTCMLVSITIFGFSDRFGDSLIAITLLGFGSGCVRPLTMRNLDFTNMIAQQRVQLLSLMERRFSIINAVLLILGGFIIVERNFQVLMRQVGIVYFLLIFLLMILRASMGRKINIPID